MHTMATIDEIRRANLGLLAVEYGGVGKLATQIGKSSAQVSQWINASPDSRTGKPRGLRSESCREIEIRCEKPEGWMDSPHTVESSNHDIQKPIVVVNNNEDEPLPIDGQQLLELIEHFTNSTKNGRDFILRAARGTKKVAGTKKLNVANEG
jgi:hypothetical protein